MRKKLIIFAGLFTVAGVLVAILLMPANPKAATWKLSDGSELSLAGVTSGKKQTMRFGNRFVDYLYPILTPALRKKFNCQVATAPNTVTNSVGLWFWVKDSPAAALKPQRTGIPFPYFRAQRDYAIITADENGMESAAPLVGNVAWSAGSNILESCILPGFPRRSQKINVRIYNRPRPNELGEKVAEFTIRNPLSTNYPVWQAGPLPVTVETNGLSVSLTEFEVGVPVSGNYAVRGWANCATRAEFTVLSRQGPLEWQVLSAQARSATGESLHSSVVIRPPGTVDPDWAPRLPKGASRTVFDLAGTCWLQEPAWKLVVELGRITNFPPEEVCAIRGVAVPKWGEINELDLKTNVNGSTIEFVGLSSDNSSWNPRQGYNPHPPDYEIKVRSPIRASDMHMRIAGIRDDQGRAVTFTSFWTEVVFTGSYSNNPALEQSFSLNLPAGAKTIDVTLAYPKSKFVEILARPTKAAETE